MLGVVVAGTEAAAREGAAAVAVQYADLPAVMSIDDAVAAGSMYEARARPAPHARRVPARGCVQPRVSSTCRAGRVCPVVCLQSAPVSPHLCPGLPGWTQAGTANSR